MIGRGDPLYLKFWIKVTALEWTVHCCQINLVR